MLSLQQQVLCCHKEAKKMDKKWILNIVLSCSLGSLLTFVLRPVLLRSPILTTFCVKLFKLWQLLPSKGTKNYGASETDQVWWGCCIFLSVLLMVVGWLIFIRKKKDKRVSESF